MEGGSVRRSERDKDEVFSRHAQKESGRVENKLGTLCERVIVFSSSKNKEWRKNSQKQKQKVLIVSINLLIGPVMLSIKQQGMTRSPRWKRLLVSQNERLKKQHKNYAI